MSGLERELAALASSVEWPEAPDVAEAVARRLAGPPRRRPVAGRRVAIAVVVVLAAILAALAVPPARTAILDWLGIGGARIVQVDELPAVSPTRSLDVLGEPTTLEDARARAGFSFARPPAGEPVPTEVRVAPGLRVSYVWRDGPRVRLLVTQFPGAIDDPALLKKVVAPSTQVERLTVDGDDAVWLEGGPHAVLFVAPDGTVHDDEGRLAGNTLLVARDGVTVRVEGKLDRAEAVAVVTAMRG